MVHWDIDAVPHSLPIQCSDRSAGQWSEKREFSQLPIGTIRPFSSNSSSLMTIKILLRENDLKENVVSFESQGFSHSFISNDNISWQTPLMIFVDRAARIG
jgi:hypothetical protein